MTAHPTHSGAPARTSPGTLGRLAPTLLALAAVWAPAAHAIDPAVVTLKIDDSPSGTRCVLTHSREVGYVIDASRGRVRIRYTEPVDFQPVEQRYEDSMLRRHRMRDERTLVLDTRSDFDRYESFELRNPYRLILDLKPELRAERRGRGFFRSTPSTIIVLDPGHGGVENGATGASGLTEKEITLALARSLKRELEQRGSGISVVLTRDEDRLVGLDERTAIANHNNADLFLSIHVNGSPRSTASGAETYYLSTDATDDEARILAALENETNQRSGASSGLDLVLWDLAQNKHLAQSSALAESIQKHLNDLTGTRNRGVRQAGFRVLMGAMMPAVLVEVGFISNREEEELLRTASYRERVVRAIATAVQEFLDNLDRYSSPASRTLSP